MDISGEQNVPASELTLIDYFVVVGYDRTIGLQVESYGESGNGGDLTMPPLERCYVASVLAHFPQKRAGLVFSAEIVSLCMPKGLKFYTQNDVPSPSMHTFANIREDGSRINGCALIYYEEVRDVSLCERMSELQTEHVRALTARDKAIERAHVPPGTVSGGTHTLPRGSRKDRTKRISYYDACGGAQLFMSKCICVLSRIPIVSAGEHIITSIHSVFTSPTQPPALPLESYIYWILNEVKLATHTEEQAVPTSIKSCRLHRFTQVPLPAPGSTLKVGLCGVDIVLQRPAPGELPFFDHSLRSVFDLLTVDKFLRLFTCFLLEHQILLCSKTLSRLMVVAESLCALAFPFRWQLAYVPILPYSQLKFMEAPVPYIMGLCYEDMIPEQIFQSNVCVLDIDTGELDMPEDVPMLPDRTEFAREVASVLIRFEDRLLEREEELVKKRDGGVVARRRKEEWSSKRMSRSFDDEAISGILSDERASPSSGGGSSSLSRAELAPLPLDDVLKQSEVLARVAAIVRRAGVDVKMENIEKELQSNDSYTNSPVCRRYFKEMKVNNAIREVFLNRFCWLLYSYEHFVIGSVCSDKETFFANRDSVANFDKAAFLSDQPDSNLPFLAAFLETQMFTSFIDAKIVSQWETPDENLQLFDARLQALKERHGLQMVRTPTYEKALPFNITEDVIAKREEALDYIVSQPHALPGALLRCYDGTFPELNTVLLEGTAAHSPLPSPWKQRHRRLRPKHQEKVTAPIGEQQAGTRTSAYIADTPKQIAHQNWMFVEQLLKETKGKTKRMLVEKMGKEALQLGHADASVNGLEENTLVASFCDLLERIWAHGLIKKQGKSSLWAHVLHHQELEKSCAISRGAFVRNSMLTPDPPSMWNRERQENIDVLASVERSILSELAHSIQKELDPAAVPAWSVSILRAANFICDKIASSTSASTCAASPKLTTSSSVASLLGRSHSLQRTNRPSIHKTNSLSGKLWGYGIKRDYDTDFAPHWTGGSSTESTPEGSPRKRSSSRAHSPDPKQVLPPLPMYIAYDLKITTVQLWGYGIKRDYDTDFAPHWTGGSSTESTPEGSPRKRSSSRAHSPDPKQVLPPLPMYIAYDLKNVLRMTEIKTDIGYARAFVRLALERKLLHKHLKTIISNTALLQQIYKRYAFLRCDDEKEQFLYHVLSLNAAEFRCFTNTFTKTKMQYRVLLVTGNTRSVVCCPIWVQIAGSLCSTTVIDVKPGVIDFKFDHKNLGILSTIRIGHSLSALNNGVPPKWFLDYGFVFELLGVCEKLPCVKVMVRNEVTAQTYRFNCGRWFGRGVDDGSLERLLVAEILPQVDPDAEVLANGMIERSSKAHSRSRTPPRARSPSTARSESTNSKSRTRLTEIQQQLGEAVNAIVKHFYCGVGARSELTQLLCAPERGLVSVMVAVFLYGRQDSIWSARFFKQHYPWDYVEKVCAWFFELIRMEDAKKLTREQRSLISHACRLVRKISSNTALEKVCAWFFELIRMEDAKKLTREQRSLISHACRLVRKISSNTALGKDGKFQLFILVTVRDHVLSGLLPLMAWTPVTAQLYDEPSFLRTPHNLTYLAKLLSSLNEFQFNLEKSLTYGID
ncbi:DENN domain-containing protein 5A [Toxocara canis]|uniref:DENN domain-containing protein 5A n=1 Tax=Toxocara canis TaxID=6265 RepID=A0A0B2W427_TOXCA|nr:DENN domain-containing protein 5A [Toxocara canis]